MAEKVILKIDSVVKVFPGVKALDNVKLDVMEGEVHALCGENGAGKSTLMKIIAGAQEYTSGHIFVDGKEHKFKTTRDAEENGISMIYQEFNLVKELSVAENMYLGRLPRNKIGGLDRKKLYRDAEEILKKLGLKFSATAKVKSLSVAQAQMTEIAKCLAKNTKIIIMDEPTAALTEEEIHVLFDIIKDLKKKKISILYISHRMDEIFKISDRLTVFRDGKYITTKNIKETNYDEVVSLMVGRTLDHLYPERAYEKKETVLELKGVTGKLVDDVNLKLHKGEILGIAGLMGSGTIELSKLIYGALPMQKGEIYINGKLCDCSSPKKAIGAGIGFVSDDRKGEGLVLIRDIRENISMASLKNISSAVRIDKKKETKVCENQVKRLRIKIRNLSQAAGKLSGGNQQKVVFAKVLESTPSILILDEPTRGVDVGAKMEIYQIMDELTKQGKSIILVSTDLPEVIGMSDRVIIMREGKTVLEVGKEELNQEIILAHASGGVDHE